MKRIKLNIKTSDRGDYTYHIFRDIDETKLPADAAELSQLTPIFELQEDIMEHTALLTADVIKVNKNKIPRDGRIPYELGYKPVIDSIHEINLECITPNGTEEILIEFDTAKEISRIIKRDFNGNPSVVPLENIEVINDNIYINYALIDTATEIQGQYYISVVEVYDDDEVIVEGLEKFQGEAHGLPKPLPNFIEMQQSVAANTELTYFNISPSAGDEGLNYYYRMIAEDPLGNISEPSNLLATLLSQAANEISYRLEVNEPGSTNEDNGWQLFADNLKHDEFVSFGKKGTDNYINYGKVFKDAKQKMLASEFEEDKSLINADSIYKLLVPNIWYDDDYQNKYLNGSPLAFRLKVIDNLGEHSEPTDVFQIENTHVPLEKIVVYKKNVSGISIKDEPITDEDVANGDATILHTFIKKGGIYHDIVTHDSEPLNQEFVDGNITIIDSLCDYLKIGAKDASCFPGQTYNYTVRIFDAFEEGSEGTVTVVDNTSTAS